MSWLTTLKRLRRRRSAAVRGRHQRALQGFEQLETRAAPSGALLGAPLAAATAGGLDAGQYADLQQPLKKKRSLLSLEELQALWALQDRLERLLELVRLTAESSPTGKSPPVLPTARQVLDRLVQQDGFLNKLRKNPSRYQLQAQWKRKSNHVRLSLEVRFDQDTSAYKASFYWGAALAAAGQASGTGTAQALSNDGSGGGGGAPPPGGGGGGGNNSPPVAVNDGPYDVLHDSWLYVPPEEGVLINDSDPDGDPLTATVQSPPKKASSFYLYPDGSFDYEPIPNFVGTDSFTYEVSDGRGGTDLATVTINVYNNPPTAVDDQYSVHRNGLLSVPREEGVIYKLNQNNQRDSDPDIPDDINLQVSVLTEPTKGDLQLNPDGSFTYTPYPGEVGTDTFTYELTDGIATDTATVTISILNRSPVAQDDPDQANPDAYTIPANQKLVVDASQGVLANDTDPDGDNLTAVNPSNPHEGTLDAFNPDGSFTYTPRFGFVGNDSFTYQATDGIDSDTATVTITVSGLTDLDLLHMAAVPECGCSCSATANAGTGG